MVIFRLLALVIIAVALMLLGYDAVQSLSAGEVTFTSFNDAWGLAHPASLESFTAWTDGLPEAVSPAVGGVMGFPGWGVLGIVGIIIALIFRRRD